MNSEKVKKIKKALKHCGEKVTCKGCPEYNNEPVIDWFKCKKNLLQKTIALINELESENEKLKHLNNSISMGADLQVESYKQEITDIEKERDKYKGLYETMYRKYCKLEAETYTKEDVKEFKDRIAELENEILQGTKDRLTFADRIELVDNAVEIKLKQFAERLKELFEKREYKAGCSAHMMWTNTAKICVDETLKEFTEDKG